MQSQLAFSFPYSGEELFWLKWCDHHIGHAPRAFSGLLPLILSAVPSTEAVALNSGAKGLRESAQTDSKLCFKIVVDTVYFSFAPGTA